MNNVRVKVSFVMDCTASMEPWIHQAKTRIASLVDRVCEAHPNTDVRVSFVGYRDYGDDEPLVQIPFQTPRDTMSAIRRVEAIGGDDQAEDVAHALWHTVGQDWSDSDVKIVFHIADAPAHGDAFHTLDVSDRYPRGDPDGLDPRDFVEKLSFLGVQYTFVRIHASTDRMVEQFQKCYVQGGSFNMIDLIQQGRTQDPEAFSDVLSLSMTQSISQHYTASQVL